MTLVLPLVSVVTVSLRSELKSTLRLEHPMIDLVGVHLWIIINPTLKLLYFFHDFGAAARFGCNCFAALGAQIYLEIGTPHDRFSGGTCMDHHYSNFETFIFFP